MYRNIYFDFFQVFKARLSINLPIIYLLSSSYIMELIKKGKELKLLRKY